MGRKSKLKSKSKFEFSEDEEKSVKKKQKTFDFEDDDDDEEEANEDLSLKIVEKAMSRTTARNVDTVSVKSCKDIESIALDSGKKKKMKKKKVKKVEKEIQLVTPLKEETKEEATEDVNVVSVPEADVVDNTTDNTILRKLLRGPRYFDPPDKSWGACYNCGEEGHLSVNCTSAKKKRPCFICGSLEHGVRQCQKGKDCFICKGSGHRAKDCPNKSKSASQASKLCLKCGDIEHIMYSCNNDYSPDDLKKIQCYVCKKFGHLCCVDYIDALSSEASCYSCGQSGHIGQECRRSRGETSAGGTPTSCYKCGEEGHFVRECTNSSKAKKRSRDLSTPTKKHSKDKKASKGYNSAPRDFDSKIRNSHKRFQFDNESPKWSSKSKRRGGWIPDESYDRPPMNGWRSPSTPNKKHRSYGLGSSGHGSSPRSPRSWNNYGSGTSRSYANGYQHRFSASRFGNSSSDGMRRHYDWW